MGRKWREWRITHATHSLKRLFSSVWWWHSYHGQPPYLTASLRAPDLPIQRRLPDLMQPFVSLGIFANRFQNIRVGLTDTCPLATRLSGVGSYSGAVDDESFCR